MYKTNNAFTCLLVSSSHISKMAAYLCMLTISQPMNGAHYYTETLTHILQEHWLICDLISMSRVTIFGHEFSFSDDNSSANQDIFFHI